MMFVFRIHPIFISLTEHELKRFTIAFRTHFFLELISSSRISAQIKDAVNVVHESGAQTHVRLELTNINAVLIIFITSESNFPLTNFPFVGRFEILQYVLRINSSVRLHGHCSCLDLALKPRKILKKPWPSTYFESVVYQWLQRCLFVHARTYVAKK